MEFFKRIFRKKPEVKKTKVPLEPKSEKLELPSVLELANELVATEKRRTSTPEEEVLERREKSSSKPLGGGVNETIFVELKDDGAGVFKPRRKQWGPGGEIEDKNDNLYKRERAAYLVDKFLGFGLVPPTVIRIIDRRTGSVQQFIADAKTGNEIDETKEDEKPTEKDWIKMKLFDYLIRNTDRHGGNWLVRNSKIYAIDHGFSFVDIIYPFSDKVTAISPEVMEKINKFDSWIEGKTILRDLLLELLPINQVDAFFERVRLVQSFIMKSGATFSR